LNLLPDVPWSDAVLKYQLPSFPIPDLAVLKQGALSANALASLIRLELAEE
jgi:hypothetical protein